MILHGNRLELLGSAVFEWLRREPLGPLEQEVILVQSNGMAEWLKMELAAAHGACAATRVELPARFIWRAYRAVLGRAAVPARSPLDKLPLTWRLMRLLPELIDQPVFAPVAGFLGATTSASAVPDTARRLQLAERLADLFDQYQVYRADWLDAWADGRDVLLRAGPVSGGSTSMNVGDAVAADQLWQPALWRAVQDELDADERGSARARLQERFLQALSERGATIPGLPRRVVLFGTTHIPQQTLQAIAALSGQCQILMAVPNPCRYHWADTIDGRELLRLSRSRQPLRGGRDLAEVPLQDMHAHGHPLLSAWGRQARDFVRQLDAYDDTVATQQRVSLPKVDLFDEDPGDEPLSLLQQVQASIRDLVPLRELAPEPIAAADRSIVFHIAHSAQREVEILHDQLLRLFADAATDQCVERVLHPRDVVVMVPDIETFAPAIRSVFGQYSRFDARYIPFGITDQRERGHHPILVALEWLLRAPSQRITLSEVLDLLDVPAVMRRLSLEAEDLAVLSTWMRDVGIRWGLHEEQRAHLDLQACGPANTWAFGLRRMLLGYATGQADAFAGIEPYAEIGGLSAALAGTLAELLQSLDTWWHEAQQSFSPAAWAQRLRELLKTFFEPGDDAERAIVGALDAAIAAWLEACEFGRFTQALALAVVREAWLQGLDEPGLGGRFKAGGVTFCTLLPMRSIPFELVCLLGMNDGDYPRRSPRADFDLMATKGQARPGDRSRRHDDRQLMLDALISARRGLYLSWAGRSQRDNSEQPPSVLISQLRDYLAAGWGQAVVDAKTTEHPLQPFSRRYFEPAGSQRGADSLFTYASEWRRAHDEQAHVADVVEPTATATIHPQQSGELTVQMLARFLANPVKAFFRHRLQVYFDDQALSADDDEAFVVAGLDQWAAVDELLRKSRARTEALGSAAADRLGAVVDSEVQRLKRSGRLPLGAPGRLTESRLAQTLQPMLAQWHELLVQYPLPHAKMRLHAQDPGQGVAVMADWLIGLRSGPGSASRPGLGPDADAHAHAGSGAGAEAEAGQRSGPNADLNTDPPQDPNQLAGVAADGRPHANAVPVWIDLQASKVSTGSRLPQPRAEKLLEAWIRCLASAAAGHPVAGFIIGSDAWLRAEPPEPARAQQALADLMHAWAVSIHGASSPSDGCPPGPRPLPTALRTGLALLEDADKAQAAYEGTGFGADGEGAEACLARLYPDFESLAAAPGFEAWSRLLYEPLKDWISSKVSVHALPMISADGVAETSSSAEGTAA